MNAVVLERAYQFKACAVTDVRKTRISMASEISLVDASVFCAVKDRSPALEFTDAIGSLFRVDLRHPPVIDILAAPHGIGEVDLPVIAIVVVTHRRRHAALGHNRMSLAKQRFADQPD